MVNFRGRQLSQIGEKYDFRRENFCRLLTFAKECHVPNFVEKIFVYCHKTVKFAKVFSLKSFPLYGSLPVTNLRLENILTKCFDVK